MLSIPKNNNLDKLDSFTLDKVTRDSLIKIHKPVVMSYLVWRCQNVYDARDVWTNIYNLVKKNSTKSIKCFRSNLFQCAISQLNDSVYRSQYNDLIELDMSSELNDLCLDKNAFWIRIKKEVSAKVYDSLWLYYMEEFTISEISTILNKNHYWVKFNIIIHRKYLSRKCSSKDLLSICLLKV